MITVRRATLDDLPAVSRLLGETWHATYDPIYGAARVDEITASWHAPNVLARHLGNGGVRLVAIRDGQIIGTAADAHSTMADDIKLAQLYVLASAQRSGAGRALLDAFIAVFPSAARITLEVEPQNSNAIAFYTRQGFNKVGEVSDCGSATSGIRAIVMARQPAL